MWFGLGLFLFLSRWLIADGMKDSFSSHSTGTYAHYLVKSFGMASGGTAAISYDIQPTHSSDAFSSYFVVLVVNEQERKGWYSTVGSSSSSVSALCQLPSLSRHVAQGKGTFTWSASSSDQYSVILLQCKPGLASNPPIVSVKVDMTNPTVDGSGVSYLDIEEITLIRFCEGQIIVYIFLLLGLLGQYFFVRLWTRSIHYLFAVTLLCAIFDAAGSYAWLTHANRTGTTSTSLTILMNLLDHFYSLASLASLLLLSLGWSTMRAFLSHKEQQLSLITLGCYFIVGISSAACVGPEKLCSSLSLGTYVLKCVLYLGIIISMNFTVTQLRVMLLHSPWAPSLSVQYARSKQFHVFRTIFVVYLMLPTVYLLLQTTVLSWKEAWLGYALTELSDMFLIIHVGVTFSPLNEFSLLRAFGTFNAGRVAQ